MGARFGRIDHLIWGVKRFRGGNEGSQYTNHDGGASPWHFDGAGSLPEGQGGADEGRKEK